MATLQFGGFQPINVDDNLLSGLRTSIQSGEKTTQQAIEELVGSFESQVQGAGGIGTPGGETAISSLGFNQNTFAQFLGARDPNTPISASLKAVLEGKEQPTQFVPGSLEGTPEVVQGTTQPAPQQSSPQTSPQGGVVNPPLPADYLQRLQAQGGQVQGGQVSPTAQYVEVNGAYFQQTPQGLTVVNDPNILRGLKTGQIKSSSGSLGSQQITGVSAPEMLPPAIRNATPEQGLQVVAQSNPQLAQDIQRSLGFTGTPSELDSRLAPMAQSNPVKFVSDIFGEIFNNLGLADVKSQFETFNKRIEDLTNDMNDEISDINDNPWLTEGVRQRQIRKVQEKYSGRIDSATASARLLQGFYDDGMQQAQWITGQALGIYNKEVDFQNQMYRDAINRQQGMEDYLFKLQTESNISREDALFELGIDKELARFKEGLGGGSSGGFGVDSGGFEFGSPEYIIDKLTRSSSSKTKPVASERENLGKFQRVIYQVSDLSSTLKNTNTDPIIGTLKNLNPYSFDARSVNAQINALVPNVARGVYGEVGVLTDTDIERYLLTLPNIKSTKQQNDFVTALTLKNAQRAFEIDLLNLADSGVNVSGYVDTYKNITEQVSRLEESLGTTGQTSNSGAEAVFDSIVSPTQSSSWIVNLWNKLF